MRYALIASMLVASACASARAPTVQGAAGGSVPLLGSWFLLDSPVGPPSGRLELEEDEATLTATHGPSYDFSWSRDGDGVELRGDDGAVLLGERAGMGALRVFAASGATSIGYPIVPVRADHLGSWVLRDPMLPAGRPLQIIAGQPANLVVDGRTLELWALRRPEGLAWVLIPPDHAQPRDGRVWHLQPLDGAQSWLVTGPLPGKGRVLTRKEAPPPWLGADTGAAPTGPDPYFPVDRRPDRDGGR